MDTKLLIDFLSKLGEQVSSTGQEVFKIYIQQAYATGITDLVVSGVLFLGVCLFVFLAFKVSKSEDDETQIWGVFFSLIVGTILMIVSIIFLTDGIKEIINPQYYALQDLISALKGAIK
jgi:hypothetical protein